MTETVKGLVLREAAYKESSRILTVLTDREGKITLSARGAKRKNSKTAAAAQLLSYSEMTVTNIQNRWYLNEATVLEQFTGLREDLSALSLGTYFAELLDTTANEGIPDAELLRLGLNSLYMLSRRKYPEIAIKCAFEMKLMCLEGYEPSIDFCEVCGTEEIQDPYFDFSGGGACCGKCVMSVEGEKTAVNVNVLQAMKKIIMSDGTGMYSVALSEKDMRLLSGTAERYVSHQLEKRFRALDYYYELEIR